MNFSQSDRVVMDGRRARAEPVWVAFVLLLGVLGCGEATTEPQLLGPEGVWQTTEASVSEAILDLRPDGSFSRVVADLAERTCASTTGSWGIDGEALSLSVMTLDNEPVSTSEAYTVRVEASTLVLSGGPSDGLYSRVTNAGSCVDYGFGAWTGVFVAEIDGTEATMDVREVRVDITGGVLIIEAEDSQCATCPDGTADILLRIDASPTPLQPGTFMVSNGPGATNTLYGRYHPDPRSVAFSGFDTTRLSPTGTFQLTAIAPERVAATFSFRANPVVERQTGPNGEGFVLVASGRVDLTYR